MRMLTREEHCKLADVDVEHFKSLQRRDHLPTTAPDKDSKGWSPTETLLLRLLNEFARAADRELARDIASSCWGVIFYRLDQIAKSSSLVVSGKQPRDELVCGAIWLSKSGHLALPRWARRGHGKAAKLIVFCATFHEVSAVFPAPMNIVATNISRSAAAIRERASTLGIDIDLDVEWSSPKGGR